MYNYLCICLVGISIFPISVSDMNRPCPLALQASMPPDGKQMNGNNSSTYNSSTTKAGPQQLKKLVITDCSKVKATNTCIQIPNKLKRPVDTGQQSDGQHAHTESVKHNHLLCTMI